MAQPVWELIVIHEVMAAVHVILPPIAAVQWELQEVTEANQLGAAHQIVLVAIVAETAAVSVVHAAEVALAAGAVSEEVASVVLVAAAVASVEAVLAAPVGVAVALEEDGNSIYRDFNGIH